MTTLSVNVNKIALLRNSRGRDFPNLLGFIEKLITLGVKGITVHPRPDERHVTQADVFGISELLADYPDVEFNIEGFPSGKFLGLIEKVNPAQCTLVPDSPEQLTSDHGWDIVNQRHILRPALNRLRNAGVRSSIFMSPDLNMFEQLPDTATDRIELYTESYAEHFIGPHKNDVHATYLHAAKTANELGIGLNAGHDLNLENLAHFLTIPNILEVSIGHAFVLESLQFGVTEVVSRYQKICAGS
ncbi:pyridoxine 5'-phosphate synthase [Gammaproteobacteria bacterium]|nr:pyridoxine 5'-phosphate synthase [Gammaproteobacteria bacterium]